MIRVLAASLHQLYIEPISVESGFVDRFLQAISTHGISYTESIQDVALRTTIEPHIVPVMKRYFDEKFSGRYLGPIFSAPYFNPLRSALLPYSVFLPVNVSESFQVMVDDISIMVGPLDEIYVEISALANSLGLKLDERDNYPGGKQKAAFQLIDLAWGALNSKLPLIFY